MPPPATSGAGGGIDKSQHSTAAKLQAATAMELALGGGTVDPGSQETAAGIEGSPIGVAEAHVASRGVYSSRSGSPGALPALADAGVGRGTDGVGVGVGVGVASQSMMDRAAAALRCVRRLLRPEGNAYDAGRSIVLLVSLAEREWGRRILEAPLRQLCDKLRATSRLHAGMSPAL